MKHLTFLIVWIITITGCTKKANIKLPAPENKLVVTCFLAPGEMTPITAVVRLSAPKFSAAITNDDDVKDALVTISNGNDSVTLNFDNRGYYINSAPFSIEAGKTYYLNVTTPDGKYASATTTVPGDSFAIEKFDVNIKTNDTNFIAFDSYLEIKDIPREVNYVNIIYESISSSLSGLYNSYDDGAPFDDDENMSKSKFIHTSSNSFYRFQKIDLALLNVFVFNCNREFYLYNKSVKVSANTAEDPFSDPVLVYSNINNGFGCFGAFTKTQRQIKLR